MRDFDKELADVELRIFSFECGPEYPILEWYGLKGSPRVREQFETGLDGALAHWLDFAMAVRAAQGPQWSEFARHNIPRDLRKLVEGFASGTTAPKEDERFRRRTTY